MKKTLILLSSGNIGGAEQSLSRLSNFSEDGEFTLGTLSGKGDLFKKQNNSNQEFCYFGEDKKTMLNLVFSCYKAIRFSNKHNFNNIYVCGFKACSIIRIISFFIQTPKIIHAIRSNPISNNREDKIFRLLERFFVYKTHGWICNSKSAMETLRFHCSIPKKKTTFIYNGIETKTIFIAPKKGKKNILTLSNFAPRKGLIEYLDVIERVLTKDKNLKFILAGRDDMKGKVQKIIKKKGLEKFIELPGFIYDTSDLIKKSHIMVMPSLLPEGCPTSILEGMSFGKPVIGYNIKGLQELILNNKTGFLVPLNNQKLMSDKILKLLNDSHLMENFGKNSYNMVIKKFTLSKMLNKHRNFINNI